MMTNFESLCRIPETDITLQVNETSIKRKKKHKWNHTIKNKQKNKAGDLGLKELIMLSACFKCGKDIHCEKIIIIKIEKEESTGEDNLYP